ncbi:hypothetical protein [Nodosilinea nodulosa]|nr:hypothetical protein [Nodosilinea nodulosa]
MATLSVPAGVLVLALLLLASMGILAWLFPSTAPSTRKKKKR